MKIRAISPQYRAVKNDIIAIIRDGNATGIKLAILPGTYVNHPSASEIQHNLSGEMHVFYEYPTGNPVIISHHEIRSMPVQIFSRKPSVEQIDSLISNLSDRTVRICNRDFTFIICGEIIAFNPDGKLKTGQSTSLGLIVNTCHTLMGHWNYLGKKLSALSISNNLAIYLTNNNKNNPEISTDLRVYKNGSKISDSCKYFKNIKYFDFRF